MGHAQQRDVGHFVELPANRRVELADADARERCTTGCSRRRDTSRPSTSTSVQPLGPLDQQRLILGHLREGMPDVRRGPSVFKSSSD